LEKSVSACKAERQTGPAAVAVDVGPGVQLQQVVVRNAAQEAGFGLVLRHPHGGEVVGEGRLHEPRRVVVEALEEHVGGIDGLVGVHPQVVHLVVGFHQRVVPGLPPRHRVVLAVDEVLGPDVVVDQVAAAQELAVLDGVVEAVHLLFDALGRVEHHGGRQVGAGLGVEQFGAARHRARHCRHQQYFYGCFTNGSFHVCCRLKSQVSCLVKFPG
jgi:hypothetical protein